MEMDQASKGRLQKITQAAQAIIYDPQRGAEFVDMMQQGMQGQIEAVLAVLGIIEQRTQIERPLVIPAAISILAILVDVTGKALGKKPDMSSMAEVQQALIQRIADEYGQGQGAPMQEAPPAQAPQQPQPEM